MLLLKSEVCELELTLLMRRSEDVTLLGQTPPPAASYQPLDCTSSRAFINSISLFVYCLVNV